MYLHLHLETVPNFNKNIVVLRYCQLLILISIDYYYSFDSVVRMIFASQLMSVYVCLLANESNQSSFYII